MTHPSGDCIILTLLLCLVGVKVTEKLKEPLKTV